MHLALHVLTATMRTACGCVELSSQLGGQDDMLQHSELQHVILTTFAAEDVMRTHTRKVGAICKSLLVTPKFILFWN